MKVVTRLLGGLANTCFQYSLGRALAIKNGAELYLDKTAFWSYHLHEYSLNYFNIQEQILTGDSCSVIQEKQFNYDPDVVKTYKKDILLKGYWQTERYFKDIEGIIRKELRVKDCYELHNDISGIIENSNSVFVHIRRTDYVTSPGTNHVHGTCNLDYYNRAIAYMNEKVKDPYFFVFSDDIEWCKQNIKIEKNCFFVEGNKNYQDMSLMYRCKHAVIANSTFSWWGAWLINSPDKIIIAPTKWFANAQHNTVDLIPKGWILL